MYKYNNLIRGSTHLRLQRKYQCKGNEMRDLEWLGRWWITEVEVKKGWNKSKGRSNDMIHQGQPETRHGNKSGRTWHCLLLNDFAQTCESKCST